MFFFGVNTWIVILDFSFVIDTDPLVKKPETMEKYVTKPVDKKESSKDLIKFS